MAIDWLGLIGAAIPKLISAGSSILGAKIEADAAKDIAKFGVKTAAANARLSETYVSESLGDFTSALAQSLGEIRQGEEGAQGFLREGMGLQDPWRQAGEDSLSGLRDAMGLGGEGGYDRARANFQEGPGYQWQMEQGIKAAKVALVGSIILAEGDNG